MLWCKRSFWRLLSYLCATLSAFSRLVFITRPWRVDFSVELWHHNSRLSCYSVPQRRNFTVITRHNSNLCWLFPLWSKGSRTKICQMNARASNVCLKWMLQPLKRFPTQPRFCHKASCHHLSIRTAQQETCVTNGYNNESANKWQVKCIFLKGSGPFLRFHFSASGHSLTLPGLCHGFSPEGTRQCCCNNWTIGELVNNN